MKIDLISCWYGGEIERFGTNFVGYGFFGKFSYLVTMFLCDLEVK